MKQQARNIADALKAIGVSRQDFRVRTDCRQLSWKGEDGRRRSCTEYGSARAHFRSEAARRLVAAHAQELADQNLSVQIIRSRECGHPYVVLVTSDYNERKIVQRNLLDGYCYECETKR